jgi:hypothetical protein
MKKFMKILALPLMLVLSAVALVACGAGRNAEFTQGLYTHGYGTIVLQSGSSEPMPNWEAAFNSSYRFEAKANKKIEFIKSPTERLESTWTWKNGVGDGSCNRSFGFTVNNYSAVLAFYGHLFEHTITHYDFQVEFHPSNGFIYVTLSFYFTDEGSTNRYFIGFSKTI